MSKILISTIAVFILITGGLLIYSIEVEEESLINSLSGVSSFIIAMLTIAYVYINSKQQQIMTKQLREMEKDRELQSQPLPCIKNIDMYIEKPKFYYTPPNQDTDPYSMHSRYRVLINLQNISNYPAVSVDVIAKIIVPRKDSNNITLSSTAIRIQTLSENQCFPDENHDDSFLFPEDFSGDFISSIRENRHDLLPILKINILYRNIIGGAFIISQHYNIYPKNEDQDKLINNWLVEIKSFKIKFKSEIEIMKATREINRDKWDLLHQEIKDKLNDSLISEDENTKDNYLFLWPIPGAFYIKNIDKNTYDEYIKELGYGLHLIPGKSVCRNI